MRMTDDPREAAAALLAGRLVALPTETVYGLGARADSPHAVARVYAAKGRPADHPLIVHVRDASALAAWAAGVPPYAAALAGAFWPGPLTLVVRRGARALDAVTGGQDTVAIRVPAHPAARAVLDALVEATGDAAFGVAAPSANRFGRVSPTTSGHVVSELADVLGEGDLVLEGGASAVGVESTIVDCTGARPAVLRPGKVSAADVGRATGLATGAPSGARAPGMLASHYAPLASVRVVDAAALALAPAADAMVGVLALADVPTPGGHVRLSAPATADEYARVLYAALREADALGLAEVLAVPPPAGGIGAAVADRLDRAAAGG